MQPVNQIKPWEPCSSTPKQRQYIVQLVRQRGMGVVDAREMAPAHCDKSLRKLSLIEASTMIDAIKAGKEPDYTKRPQRTQPAKERPPRLPKGVARMATWKQSEFNRRLTEWLAREYGMTVKQFEDEKMAKCHYRTHGGPMHKILSSDDCRLRIEVLKEWKKKAIAARNERQRSAASEAAVA